MYKVCLSILLLLFMMRAHSQTSDDERLAIQFFQLREYDKAEVLLRKQFDLKPLSFYDYLYKTYIQLRKYPDAVEVTRQMIKSNGKNLEYRYNLGLAYDKARDSLKATKEWQLINDQLKDNEHEVNNYLKRYMESRNWSMAEDLIIKYQTRTKNKEAFFSHQLNIYIKQHRLDEAVQLAFSQLEKDQTNYLGNFASYDFLQSSMTAQRLMEKKVFSKLSREPSSNKWNELAMQLAMTVKDYEQALQLAKAYEKRTGGQGHQVFQIAEIAASEHEYGIALDGFDYLIQTTYSALAKPSQERKIATLYTKIKNQRLKDSVHIGQLNAEFMSYLSQYGYTVNTADIQLMYSEFTMKYLKRTELAAGILQKMLEIPMLAKRHVSRAKLDLADIKLAMNDIWEASLLYGQVDKEELDGPLGEEARFKNSKVFYFNGDYELAEDLLSILKSSTSELIANDALQLAVFIQENQGEEAKEMAMKDVSNAELLFYQNRPEEAIKILNSLKKVFPSSNLIDDVLLIEANYNKTVENDSSASILYKLLYEKYPNSILADRALYEWAKLEEEIFKHTESAKEAYLNLLTKYKDSVFATDARKRLRKLRGEQLEDET